MDIKDFIGNFAAQLDETEEGLLSAETRFHDLDEYSSIIALSLIGMVDEEYGVSLRADDIRQAVTIGDLFEIVKQRVNG